MYPLPRWQANLRSDKREFLGRPQMTYNGISQLSSKVNAIEVLLGINLLAILLFIAYLALFQSLPVAVTVLIAVIIVIPVVPVIFFIWIYQVICKLVLRSSIRHRSLWRAITGITLSLISDLLIVAGTIIVVLSILAGSHQLQEKIPELSDPVEAGNIVVIVVISTSIFTLLALAGLVYTITSIVQMFKVYPKDTHYSRITVSSLHPADFYDLENVIDRYTPEIKDMTVPEILESQYSYNIRTALMNGLVKGFSLRGRDEILQAILTLKSAPEITAEALLRDYEITTRPDENGLIHCRPTRMNEKFVQMLIANNWFKSTQHPGEYSKQTVNIQNQQ